MITVELDVSLVKDIRWNDQAFDSLALPGDYKHLLLAFAKSQSTTADQFDDVIEGKGKGMVMLLEGPPGVGKTLTVESGTRISVVLIQEYQLTLPCSGGRDESTALQHFRWRARH